MRESRIWRLLIVFALLAAALTIVAGCGGDDDEEATPRGDTATAPRDGGAIKVAIMTDCKDAFGLGYELDIGGAQAAIY